MLDIVRDILTVTPWEQVLPLLFVFVFTPLLALGTYQGTGTAVSWFANMVFENLGLGFAWSWINNHDALSSSKEKKSIRKKHIRRSELPAAADDGAHRGSFMHWF